MKLQKFPSLLAPRLGDIVIEADGLKKGLVTNCYLNGWNLGFRPAALLV